MSRPRVWMHCGCLGCSLPLLALAAAIVLLIIAL